MKAKWIRRWFLKRQVKTTALIFRKIERGIKRVGMPRKVQKRMWRDFAKGVPGSHEEILELIQK